MKKAAFIPLDSSSEPQVHARLCEHAGCDKGGEFRAPKSPGQLREYYWFCLDHVREYNKQWDFYQGMSEEEIEASRISDVTWNRPSWPVGGWRAVLEKIKYMDRIDPFLKLKPSELSLPKEVKKAIEILDVSFPIALDALKKEYKKLVKRHHPDLHAGSKEAEDRLKSINEAYRILKDYLGRA